MTNIEYRKISEIKRLDGNPRKISKEQMNILKESISKNADYFEARPIILSDRTGELVIIAGNQRYEACRQLGIETVPTVLLSGLTEEREREIIIRDNVNNGEWDDELLKDWDADLLSDWGMDVPEWNGISPDDCGEEFSLPDGDKEPFQHISFILADAQAEILKEAIKDAKKLEEFKYIETYGNENGNGNALYLIIQQWVEQKR